jgi:hypothetical protein
MRSRGAEGLGSSNPKSQIPCPFSPIPYPVVLPPTLDSRCDPRTMGES